MSQIPVFVISLSTSTHRRRCVTSRLNRLGVDFEFIDAIRGTDLPEDTLRSLQEQSREFAAIRGYGMQASEIGCSMSHLRFYQILVERSLELACVLEDDVLLSDEFPKCLESETLLPLFENKLQFLMLGHFICGFPEGVETSIKTIASVSSITTVRQPIQGNHGTHGYVINQKTAKALIETHFNYQTPIDHLTGTAELNGIARLVVSPPAVLRDYAIETMMLDRVQAQESYFSTRPTQPKSDSDRALPPLVEKAHYWMYLLETKLQRIGKKLGLLDPATGLEHFRMSPTPEKF